MLLLFIQLLNILHTSRRRLSREACTVLSCSVSHVVLVTESLGSNQVRAEGFALDAITVSPQRATLAPGVKYMTDYDELVFVQLRDYSNEPIRMNGKRC